MYPVFWEGLVSWICILSSRLGGLARPTSTPWAKEGAWVGDRTLWVLSGNSRAQLTDTPCRQRPLGRGCKFRRPRAASQNQGCIDYSMGQISCRITPPRAPWYPSQLTPRCPHTLEPTSNKRGHVSAWISNEGAYRRYEKHWIRESVLAKGYATYPRWLGDCYWILSHLLFT